MSSIYIYGSGPGVRLILNWLSDECGISSSEVAAIVEHPELASERGPGVSEVSTVAFDTLIEQLDENDMVIVVSDDFCGAVGKLFAGGCYNVYDGGTILRRASAASRLQSAVAPFHVGPNTPLISDEKRHEFRRYLSDPVAARSIPEHSLFVVNSMPKSGTIWMIAMLEDILRVKARQQITVSHVRDIETDWPKWNNHGAVAMVRDMRAVVVSCFHHLSRSDLQAGFTAPRYPEVEGFYFEYFIGQICGDHRYYFGDLGSWLDYLGAHSIPVIRYEDLVTETLSALRKVMTFWKIDVSDAALDEVIDNYSFEKMRETVAGREGYVSDMLRSGHLRRGEIGKWEDELSARVTDDIESRFADYQHRLYCN